MTFEKCNYYKQIIRITIFLLSLYTEEFNRTPKKCTGMESVQATYIGKDIVLALIRHTQELNMNKTVYIRRNFYKHGNYMG